MKRLLRKGMCLALGLTCLPAAFSQELNFRAVAPRSTPASEIPVTVSRPMPLDEPIIPVVRFKVHDEGGVIVPADASRSEGVRLVKTDVPRLLPQGAPGEFAAPPPQLIAPPVSGTVVGSSPGSIIIGPTMSGPIMPGPMGYGPVVSGPISGPIVSGPVSSSGCACNGGFSLYNGFVCDDPVGVCCDDSCFAHWCPLQRIYDFFACGCRSDCCEVRTPFWVRGEYLAWSVTQQIVPPLATQFVGGPGNFAGLPLGTGTVIYDARNIDSSAQNGGRITMGFWFPRHNDWGMDASYFSLGNRSSSFTSSSTGEATALGRPFVENDPAKQQFGQEAAQIVAGNFTGLNPFLTIVPGSIAIDTRTELWGIDANLRHKLCCGPRYWIDGLIGFRHVQLRDNFSITENIGPRSNGVFATDHTTVNDRFGTNNVFNGGQVGLEAEWRFRPRFTLGGSFKIAAGNMHQTIVIDGSTTVQGFNGNPAARQTQAGGLLAQGTNIGSYATDRFAVVPELGLKLGWDITQHWRFYAGYNVLYLSNVVRAGEQIDPRVNSSQFAFTGAPVNRVPGPGVLTPGSPATPAVLYKTSEFWAQGVSLGLEYRY
jgi:hypothetical protein